MPVRGPVEAGNGLRYVFHVALLKAPPFRAGLITVFGPSVVSEVANGDAECGKKRTRD